MTVALTTIVSLSGGLGSAEALKRVIAERGKPVTILKDERGGTTKPMSLYAFIPRIEAGDYPRQEWGACGCFVGQPTLFELPALEMS